MMAFRRHTTPWACLPATVWPQLLHWQKTIQQNRVLLGRLELSFLLIKDSSPALDAFLSVRMSSPANINCCFRTIMYFGGSAGFKLGKFRPQSWSLIALVPR